MSDRVRLACEIASRTDPRFIDTNLKPKRPEDRFALAREIASLTEPRFIEIPRERGAGKVCYTEEPVMRRGLSVEEWRPKTIRRWSRKRSPA
jgi:hypothetical protein